MFQSIKNLVYFLIPLTLMISCSSLSDTLTELDEEDQQEQADQNQNSGQEEGSTSSEPVTYTESGTLTEQDDEGSDPGSRVPFYYDIYEIEGLEGQMINLNYEASCRSGGTQACGAFVAIIESENFDDTDMLGGNFLGNSGDAEADSEDELIWDLDEVVFPEDGIYWIVVMGFYQYGESFDKIDFTLTWTIEEYIEELIPEGSEIITGTLTTDDLSSYCYQVKGDIYYDLYEIQANECETIDFRIEASHPSGAEISDMGLAFYDPKEFNPDELFFCADFSNLSYHHAMFDNDDFEDNTAGYSAHEVSATGSYWFLVESPLDYYENSEEIDYTITWWVEDEVDDCN